MSGIKPIDVEIFPTGAKLLAGHRLRISIQAADTPHALPTLSTLLGTGVITIHTGPAYPSSLTLPTVRPTRVSTVTTAKLAADTTKVGKANSVAVTVTGGSTPAGKVGVYVAGVLVRTATLSGGKATVALPARVQVGGWPVVVKYLADAYHLPSKGTAYWTTVR